MPEINSLTVVAKPHPLSGEVVMAEFPVGSTLQEIVGPDALCCRVEIDGQEIAPEWWPRIRPKKDTPVLVTRFPQGHMGVKDILRMVAFAALVVATAFVPALLPFAIAAGLSVVASLVSALIPPTKPATPADTSVTRLQSITGTQNQALPYSAIPCIIGTMRFFPPLAALPYSELSGNDQYVRFLFDLGYGVPAVSNMKIGENDLANFTDVEIQIGSPRNFIPDSDGTLGTWTGDSLLVFSSTGGAVAGGKWTYTGTGAASGFRVRKSVAFPVVPGSICVFSGYVDASHVTSGAPFIAIEDPTVTTGYDILTATLGSNGRIIGAPFTIPGGVTSVVAIIDTGNCVVANGQPLVFSDLQLEGNSTATAYQTTVQPLFTSDVTETAAGDVLNTDGSSAVRTSATAANELGADIIFPSGLFGIDSKGKAINVSCNVRIEVSPVGAGTYSAVPSLPGGTAGIGLTISNPAAVVFADVFKITSSERKTLRIGFRWKTYTAFGAVQYDIRVTRVSTNWGTAVAGSQFGDLTWAILRTVRYTSPSTTGTEKVALRIKATDQLNGTINQFNCTASQPIPVWNGSAWVSSLTGNNNPAYVYRWVLCDSPANPRPVSHSRVDDAALIAWGAECTAKEFTFDVVQDQTVTVFELLKDICAAGRASFTVRDGKYSVVRDVAQTVPVQHFSPRNSWGFQGSRNFIDQIHALRVHFVNPQASYQTDEIIVYDDGFSLAGAGGTTIATKFETFEIRGCTNANGAWRLARYHLAVARLRPNLYNWNADIEHIVCQRGDLVKVAQDVISVGLAWGRIKTITQDGSHNVTAVTVDEPLDIAAATAYGIRIRTNDGGTHLSNVTATVGLGITALTLVTPIPPVGGVASVNPGDLFLFGLAGQESIDMIVMKIEPGADLSAKITAVDAAPAVLTADSGTPPTFISNITGAPWNDAPPPPDLIIVASGEASGSPDDGGINDPGITIGVGRGPGHIIRTPIRPTPFLLQQ
jgi:hypothetical protein